MAKGSIAKEQVMQKIIECFGQDQSFVYDKKLYINTKENGEPVQICLSFTCPKTIVSPTGETVAAPPPKSAFSGGIDFAAMAAAPAEPTEKVVPQISQSERETVLELMKSLGL